MDKRLEYMSKLAENINQIDNELFDLYNIKQGLRNKDRTGVLIGLTRIANVVGYEKIDGIKTKKEGELFYREYELQELLDVLSGKTMLFERVAYLLIMGKLPTDEELDDLLSLIYEYSKDYINFDFYSTNIMNKLQHDVSYLYSFDADPDLITQEKILEQTLKIMGYYPDMILKGILKEEFNIAKAEKLKKQKLGTAKYFLSMLSDREYTDEEVNIFDELLVIHAEHGGGNNSTFSVRLVTSAYTDTYSSIVAGICSLKGLRHGGANVSVSNMVENIKENCDYKNTDALKKYLEDILDKKTFDGNGLIYGMGHAIYTLSDPRAVRLKNKASLLAEHIGIKEEWNLYNNIEELTKQIFKERKGDDFDICCNVDLYSGFVYSTLFIDKSAYTPIFSLSRVPAWCAHRSEQIFTDKHILRPAYKTIQ